jgi:hypothetical protein
MEQGTIELKRHAHKTNETRASAHAVTGIRYQGNSPAAQAQAQAPSKDTGEVRNTKPMAIKILRPLATVTGVLLGSVAVSVQVGSILVCLSMILWGPGFITELVAQLTTGA